MTADIDQKRLRRIIGEGDEAHAVMMAASERMRRAKGGATKNRVKQITCARPA